MNESDERFIREAIRREIRKELLSENVSASAADVKDVWEAIKRVFSVTKIAIKSVISGLVVNVQLMFTVDPAKVDEYVRDYKTRQQDILREYKTEMAPVYELLSDYEPILFMTAPGAYLAAKVSLQGPEMYNDVLDYMREAGVELDPQRPPGGDTKEESFWGAALASLGVKPTGASVPTVNDFKSTANEIKSRLDSIFGVVSGTPIRESRLLLEASDFDEKMKEITISILKQIKPENLGFDPGAAEKIAKVKEDEANDLAKLLTVPQRFIEAIGNAKSITDATNAVKMLEGTPYVIKGIEGLKPEAIDAVAKSKIKDLKDDKQKMDLVLEANPAAKVKGPITDEIVLGAAKTIILKKTLAKALLDSKKELPKVVEELRTRVLKTYTGDVKVDELKKYDPDNPVIKAVEAGVKKIETSGILAPASPQ